VTTPGVVPLSASALTAGAMRAKRVCEKPWLTVSLALSVCAVARGLEHKARAVINALSRGVGRKVMVGLFGLIEKRVSGVGGLARWQKFCSKRMAVSGDG
jgi:hypothetical protein